MIAGDVRRMREDGGRKRREEAADCQQKKESHTVMWGTKPSICEKSHGKTRKAKDKKS